MSVWRQKAIECIPELKREFEDPDLSPYIVFSMLLSFLKEAHINKDNNRLKKIYDFAEWCHRQKDQKLWNSAGVSFYEHLGDDPETFAGFTIWIKKEIYFDVRDLLNHRFDEDKMKALDKHYGMKR